ncbi:hypothetical protein A6B43_00230 [Vespertiliibacter pulmonis]|uniref:Scaffolding protein n=1 Tax=Vespertiliibacter pulmonis TaxID=1443036 RepID=A0A3N4W921_9PAST|nr:hypothetical protein [Vespertiliibacter pulmonis]QLB20073.1 hypothetical protein A6B43_00230 [Vespertiliibacter pulmonis]RPE86037.1 hypothetical protein EDC46_0428 [Vespertiliibacter pulmonis]
MEHNNQPKLGDHLPVHVREKLMKMYQKQQDETPESSEENPIDDVAKKTEIAPDAEPSTTASNIDEQTEPQDGATEPTVPHSGEDNDVKAWKGRLRKEQLERQKINARLIEEAEAREKAEAKLRELQQLQQKQEQATDQSKSTITSEAPSNFSDAELAELRILDPVLYAQLTAQKKQPPSVHLPVAEVPPQTKAERPSVTEQAPQMSEREKIWYAEVQRELPEIQGLLGDSNFVEFAKSKTDWTGATGLDFIQRAGSQKDVRNIPAIRALLDEYQQSKEQLPEKITVAPQKATTVKTKVTTPKTMTKKDEAKAEMLARQGKTAELKAFLATFKQ